MKTLLLLSLLSFSFSLVLASDELASIKNEVIKIENEFSEMGMKSPISVEKEVSYIISKNEFKKYLAKLDNDHPLNHYNLLDYTFKEFLSAISEASSASDKFELIIKEIKNLREQDHLYQFQAGEVARRVWTGFTNDSYFLISTKDKTLILKVRELR